MALPGITKKREEARAAEAHTLIARRALSDFIATLPNGVPCAVRHAETLRRLSADVLALHERQVRLWDEVAFMEET